MWFADKLGPQQPVNGMPAQLVIHENLIGDQPQPLQSAPAQQPGTARGAAPDPEKKKKKGWF